MTTSLSSEIRFQETQRFTQIWLWAIIGFCSVLPAILIMAGVGEMDDPDEIIVGVIVALATGILVPALMAMFKMTTRIYDDRVEVRFFPLTTRTISLDEIDSIEVRTYRPVREYGGWGIKGGFGHGMALNVKGNRGVQLVMKDGKRLLIGSQQAEELAVALTQAKARAERRSR